MESLLLLPGDPGFDAIQALNPPPGQANSETGRTYYMGLNGILKQAETQIELDEYLLGGAYEEVIRDQELFWIEEL